MRKILVLCAFMLSVWGKNLVLLDPASIEIAYMLGIQDQIKGVAISNLIKLEPSDKIAKLENVGSHLKPDLEKIVALKPDLVVLGHHSLGLKDSLKNLNIESMEFDANNIDEICQNAKILGAKTGSQDKANELCANLDSLFEGKTALKGKKILPLFIANPPMAFSGKTLPGDIFNKLGMINLANDLTGDTPIISSEYILEQNPDIMVIIRGDVDSFLASNPTLKQVKAVKEGKILNLPMLLFGSPRISEAIEQLYKDLQ